METKDWITLFVPIISNGLLLFIFQHIYEKRSKRNENRRDYQKDILQQFHILLQDFYTAYLEIRDIDETISGKNVSFSEVWNPAAEKIEQLIVFHTSNPSAISKVDNAFAKCVEKWQYINGLLYESAINHNGKISAECAAKFSFEYEQMDKLIKTCLKECGDKLLKL